MHDCSATTKTADSARLPKPRNGPPHRENFLFTPKLFPQLASRVVWLTWNGSKKTLHLSMGETNRFEVARWIETVEKQHAAVEKSPFMDLNSYFATLSFRDANGVEAATLTLFNLRIEDYHCELGAGRVEMTSDLCYEIVLSYQEAELTVRSEQWQGPEEDAEWQSVPESDSSSAS